MTVTIYIPTNSARRFSFSIPSLAFIVCIFFDDGHSDWCEVVLYYSFDLHFSNNDIEHLVPLDNLYVFFGERSI